MADLQVIDYIPRLVKVYCDNPAVVFLAKSNKRESQTLTLSV